MIVPDLLWITLLAVGSMLYFYVLATIIIDIYFTRKTKYQRNIIEQLQTEGENDAEENLRR